MNIFKRTRIRYILHRHAIAHSLWAEVTAKLAILQGLTSMEKAQLRELTTQFLYEKQFFGARELRLDDTMHLIVAVQACLPVLGLGIDCLSGWTEIIVYPEAFRISRDQRDTIGVVHHQEQELIGESWSRGPLILSWDSIEHEMHGKPSGRNVVIHEIAHKLDMLNGPADGFPPLHRDMIITEWSTALSAAYENLVRQVEHHHDMGINPYGATSPAEFFAVISEYFFRSPEALHENFPEVYRQLQHYYRQNPLLRHHQIC